MPYLLSLAGDGIGECVCARSSFSFLNAMGLKGERERV